MHSLRNGTIVLLAILLSGIFITPALANDKGTSYKVTITNLTKKQVLTPPILVNHRNSFTLFTPTQPASAELAALAEGGDTQPLAAVLGTRSDVGAVVLASAPILPGTSITLEVNTKKRFNKLSLAGMLATSNDAFFALNSINVPRRGLKSTAVAYDAGSEANTELCSDIPGPPCAPDSGNQRVTAGAEGFVHVHNGIHGTGDLNAANMTWHNPVAMVVIERMR